MFAKDGYNVAVCDINGELINKTIDRIEEAGTTANIPLRAILTKGAELKGSMLRKRSVKEKGEIISGLVEKVWPKIETGEIRPTVYKVLPITSAYEPQQILERGENIGKVVLKVRD